VLREGGGTAVKEIARAKIGLTLAASDSGPSAVRSVTVYKEWRIAVNMGGERRYLGTEMHDAGRLAFSLQTTVQRAYRLGCGHH
jgi:hypothetical protein